MSALVPVLFVCGSWDAALAAVALLAIGWSARGIYDLLQQRGRS